MGFVSPSCGTISLLGMPPAQALRRNIIAYVPQSEEIDWSFPVLVEDVVMMGRYGHMGMLRRAGKEDRRIVNDALERVDMLPYRHRQIGELSGGQKKRVFLARSIAQRGKVILLDEPFTGVDVNTEKKIITLLGELKEGSTTVVSTHNLTSVSEYCDYTVLVKGTVLASGPVATTFTPENIKRRLVQTLRVSQIYCQFREDQHSQIINLPLNMKIKAGHHELASGAFWLSIHAQCHVDFGNGRRNMCFYPVI